MECHYIGGDDQTEGSRSRYAYWVPYTLNEILAMVIHGKQWGHIPKIGKHVSEIGAGSGAEGGSGSGRGVDDLSGGDDDEGH
nr:hypothetical protein [Tanacetum cinerariifolium]